MEENIVSLVAEAERQAAEIKAKAEERAQEISAQAEKSALAARRESEEACAALRREGLERAEREAEEMYKARISEGRAAAKKYTDGLTKHTDVYVTEIVGRIVK